TVRVVKLTTRPIETGTGSYSIGGSDLVVTVPLHDSVSVVSAACAVGNPTSITARAITHEQRRSIEEETQANPCVSVPTTAPTCRPMQDAPRCPPQAIAEPAREGNRASPSLGIDFLDVLAKRASWMTMSAPTRGCRPAGRGLIRTPQEGVA